MKEIPDTNKTDREVNRTLQTFDDLQPATTDDFYYSRLQARMEKEHARQEVSGKMVPWAAAAVLLFLILNVLVLNSATTDTTGIADTVSEEDLSEWMAADYPAPDMTVYNLYSED